MHRNPNKIRQKYANWPILSVKSGENGYPSKLTTIHDKPAELFYKGAIPVNSLNIAIVGSRKISDYGAAAIKHIFNNLNDKMVCIVSGLAYGIDAEAHKMAIKNGLKTVAILGTPIGHIYPYTHTRLAEDILAGGGAVVSEGRPPDSENKTMKWSFAQRNRIIAGMCDATIIVEAAKNSGALITAGYARKYGRAVFTVPGSIFADNSQGANSLLSKGALPLTCPDDLLAYFPQIHNTDIIPESTSSKINTELKSVYELISQEPVSIFELAGQINIPTSKLGAALSMLEIMGKIEKSPGNKFRKISPSGKPRSGN
ncbi:DNA-processing protein DprA [Patescibacteria group bacterium]|nr:DNA-processing protein DprA [Patescibacteria group bacterium]